MSGAAGVVVSASTLLPRRLGVVVVDRAATAVAARRSRGAVLVTTATSPGSPSGRSPGGAAGSSAATSSHHRSGPPSTSSSRPRPRIWRGGVAKELRSKTTTTTRAHRCFYTSGPKSAVTTSPGEADDPGGSDEVVKMKEGERQVVDEVVEGVWVFHRHGDRTPSVPLCDDHHVSNEAEFWRTKLPHPRLMEYLDSQYPTVKHPSNHEDYLDGRGRQPFGSLTALGVGQMRRTGRIFYDRYHSVGVGDGGNETETGLSAKEAGALGGDRRGGHHHHHNHHRRSGHHQHHRHTYRHGKWVDEYDEDHPGDRHHRSHQNHHHRFELGGGGNSEGANRARDFLRHWDVSAYSTNYLRTVTSVRSLLDGLLHGRGGLLDDELDEDEVRRHPPDGLDGDVGHHYHAPSRGGDGHRDPSSRPTLAPSTSTSSSSHDDEEGDHDHRIQIHIRDRDVDPLNAFDRDPELVLDLVQSVVSTPQFASRDSRAIPLASRLANHLPGLTKRASAKFGGPSGINWVHAADHFVCRTAHGLSFSVNLSPRSAGTTTGDDVVTPDGGGDDDDDDGKATCCLRELHVPTEAHLSWRFRQWYTSPPLLAEFAGPPLREVVDQIRSTMMTTTLEEGGGRHDGVVDDMVGSGEGRMVEPNRRRRRRPFVLYSCHDVTILSLLYGIGADVVRRGHGEVDDDDGAIVVDDGDGDGGSRYWPQYASTLAFELVRRRRRSAEEEKEEDLDFVVRIRLNGEPVGVVRSSGVHGGGDFGNGDDGDGGGGRTSPPVATTTTLSVDDFEHLVETMVRAGEEAAVVERDDAVDSQ